MSENRIYCFDEYKLVPLSSKVVEALKVKTATAKQRLAPAVSIVGGLFVEDCKYVRHNGIDFLVASSGSVWTMAMRVAYEGVPKSLIRSAYTHMKADPTFQPGRLQFFFFPDVALRFGVSDGELHDPMLMTKVDI